MMNPAALAFTCFWATPVLVRDYTVLVRCGRVQANAIAAGLDTPAGWWLEAAKTYPPCDAINRLAAYACTLAALDLREAVPS
ncbi:MAG TPA: hypothetical protein VMI54_04225 [Polyangiaceae bacterium]|nr:hypothetical protein [Polyangiaceae bacterium]